MGEEKTIKLLEEIRDLQQKQLKENENARERYKELKGIAEKELKRLPIVYIILGISALVYVLSVIGEFIKLTR